MKIPLHYQITEYDCGPTTLGNAMLYLFRREEIPPEVIKHIMLYSLDAYNGQGETGKNGTSCMAMQFLSHWLNGYAKAKRFPISAAYLSGEAVRIGETSLLTECMQQGGGVVVRLLYGCWHYVLLTGMEGEDVALFDPYYRKRPFPQEGIRIVEGFPNSKNRLVSAERFNRAKGPYALGPPAAREAVLLYNTNTRKTPGRTIEYFI